MTREISRWYVCYDGQDPTPISPRFDLHSEAIAWGVQWAEEDPTHRAFYALKDFINDPFPKEEWSSRLMSMGRRWLQRHPSFPLWVPLLGLVAAIIASYGIATVSVSRSYSMPMQWTIVVIESFAAGVLSFLLASIALVVIVILQAHRKVGLHLHRNPDLSPGPGPQGAVGFSLDYLIGMSLKGTLSVLILVFLISFSTSLWFLGRPLR